MIDLAGRIQNALVSIEGADTCYGHPEDFNTLPIISFYELNNSSYAQAGGREHISDIAYMVDIWSDDASLNASLSLQVDAQLGGMKMVREMCMDLTEESGIRHRTMRYGCLAGQDYKIYQK